MRVLLIGGAGQLGRDLQRSLSAAGHRVAAPPRAELDLEHPGAVTCRLERDRPELVINCAALHDVAACERNPALAFAINAIGPRHLARCCRRLRAALYHVSTDYVFDGAKGRPYQERDRPRPLMVYGASKLAGEQLARAEHERGARIIRTSGLFGRSPCRGKPGGRSFVDTMLALGRQRGRVEVVEDVLCSPTSTAALARQVAHMVRQAAPPGLYHAVNEPGMSWYAFARMIFEVARLPVEIAPVHADGGGLATFRRPADSRLTNCGLRGLGLDVMGPLRAALRAHLLSGESTGEPAAAWL